MLKCSLFQSFSPAGRICSGRFIILTEQTLFLPHDFIHYEVIKLICFMHTFLMVFVGFVPGQQDLTSDAIEPLIKV